MIDENSEKNKNNDRTHIETKIYKRVHVLLTFKTLKRRPG